MKQIIFLTLLVSLPIGRLWAVSEGIFTSVTGKIEIRGHQGHMLRIAEKDSTVTEGERIVAGADAQATLQTFDGSELTITPNTDFWLDKLQKPSDNDKTIHFKLLLGQLMAKVTKLLTAKSSFEIEAGGVICGVRGTQYQVKYDPATNTVFLGVLDGTVYANANGQTTDYGAGSSAVYHNGIVVGGGNTGLPTAGSGGGNGNGTPGTGGEGDNVSPQIALLDFDHQFLGNVWNNPGSNNNLIENIITNPSLTSTYLQVNVTANVPAGEYVP